MTKNTLSFEDELFNELKTFANQIRNILLESKYYKRASLYAPYDNGFTLAIDSGWGTGKTTFLMRLEDMFNKDSNFKAVYYNAWDNDDFNNPLIPIISAIRELLEEDINTISQISGVSDKKDHLENFINSSTKLGKYFINAIAKTNVNINLGVISFENNIENFANELNKFKKDSETEFSNIFNDFDEYKAVKELFLNSIRELIPQGGKKRVIIIDELDRCKPSFAIKTLEVIKHFFNNNENIQFIFGVDIEQLSHSIATTYGQGMDASGYLRRFFDLQVTFPPIDKKEFIRMNLDDDLVKNEKLIYNLLNVTENLRLSFREIEKFLSYLKLLYKTSLRETKYDSVPDCLSIYYYLIIIITKYSNFWNEIECATYLRDSTLDRFKSEMIQKDNFIPGQYFWDSKLEPFAVKKLCNDILFRISIREMKIKDIEIKGADISTILLSEIDTLCIFKKDRNKTIYNIIKENLSIIPFNIMKKDDKL